MYGYLQYLYGGSGANVSMQPGIYLKTKTPGFGNDQFVNSDPGDVEWFGIDSEGTRFPTTGFKTTQFAPLTADAINAGKQITWQPSIDDPPSPDTTIYSVTFDIYYLATAPVLTIDQADNSLSFVNPETATGTINMGNGLLPSEPFSESISWEQEGDKAFTFQTVDYAGTATNAVNRTYRYAPDMRVVAIDGDYSIYPTYTTEEYSVDVTYVVGGLYGTINGELGTINGEIGWIGGQEVTEPGVAILNGDNDITIGPVNDDFGNSKNVITYTLEKIPKVAAYSGPSSYSLEEYSNSLVPYTFDVDVGAPYQSTEAVTLSFVGVNFNESKTFGPLTADQPIPITRNGKTNYPAEFTLTWTELDVQAMPVRMFDFITDRFKFTQERPQAVSGFENNIAPGGDAQLKLRSGVGFANDNRDVFYDTPTLDLFTQNISPKFDTVVDAITDSPYFNPGVSSFIDNDFLHPQRTHSYAGFMYTDGDTSVYLVSRATGNAVNRNGSYISGGQLNVIAGGTTEVFGSGIDIATKAVFFAHCTYFNGVDWVDDFFLDDAYVYQNRNTGRGTNFSPGVPVLLGARWSDNTDVIADPDTAGVTFNGGKFGPLTLSNQQWTEQQIRAIKMRTNKELCCAVNGSSTANGTTDGTPWVDLIQQRADEQKYNIRFVNFSEGGRRFYSGTPNPAFTGWESDPHFATGGTAGSSTQSTDVVDEKCSPEMVLGAFTTNLSNFDSYAKNPDAKQGVGPFYTGNNAYSDEFHYGNEHCRAFYEDRNIVYFYGSPTPKNSTDLVTEDLITITEAQGICAQVMEGDSTIEDYLVPIGSQLWTSPSDFSIKPEYNLDNVHYTGAGHVVIADAYILKTDAIFEKTRNTHFDPIVEFINPMENGNVFESPADILWSHDNTEVTDQETFVKDVPKLVTRQYTNPEGRTGSNTTTITYVDDPRTDAYISLDLTTLVDDGGTDKFLDRSVNGNDAIVLGTPTFATNPLTGRKQWILTAANLDCLYIPGTENYDFLNTEWAWSMFVEVPVQFFAAGILMAKTGTTFQRSYLFMFQQAVRMRIGDGASTIIKTTLEPSDGRIQIGWQNRWTGTEWVLDGIVDGVVVVSDYNVRGTATNTVPLMVGARANTDPTVSTAEHFEGSLDNMYFWQRTLSAQEWDNLKMIGE